MRRTVNLGGGPAARAASVVLALAALCAAAGGESLPRLQYNAPGLSVDLGVGLWAWPMPMDYDGDGDLDLVVSCSDVPYNGTYFFENPGGKAKMPILKRPVRIGGGRRNVQVSFVDGRPRVLEPGYEFRGFRKKQYGDRAKLPAPARVHAARRLRANQWKYVDYDGDGRVDLAVGVGDWTDYGWDDAFDANGRWTRGPLHGYVYLLRNAGTSEKPTYDKPRRVRAGGRPIDVFGMPSPNFADFDADGDLDVVCGDFVDRLTYFENVGTRKRPTYAAARPLKQADGQPLRMGLCMIVPAAIDWDGDGDVDLVVGQEDGRVALIEHTGRLADRSPVFAPPRFFRQQAGEVKFGALATPVGFDWDGDGDDDIVSGNTAGEIAFIENLGGDPPKWAAPKLLAAGGRVIRIQAGPNGSIQGPAEAKWGYTTLAVADWDHDQLPDLVVNSIWGKVVWYRNVGTRKSPKLAAAAPVEVEWSGKPPKPAWNWWDPAGGQLVTQWRTTPVVIDLNRDKLNDLVMLDHEGYLALFERARRGGRLVLLPPKRVFLGPDGKPLLLSRGRAGKSGRRKLCLVDWDRDGRLDLMLNSRSIDFYRNVGTGGRWVFENKGPVSSHRLAGHTTSPTTVDFDRDGKAELLIGAEDGCFYHLRTPEPTR